MKKLITLSLVCCLVLAMSTPVSADYYWHKDVDASDLVDELITYVKYNCSIEDWCWRLSRHEVEKWNETKKENAFDLRFACKDRYYLIVLYFMNPFPWPETYEFTGVMHVEDRRALSRDYTLTIADDDRAFIATGNGWTLKVRERRHTRFK